MPHCDADRDVSTAARFSRAADYPFGLPEEAGGAVLNFVAAEWGSGPMRMGLWLWLSPSSMAARPALAPWTRPLVSPSPPSSSTP